MEQDDINLTAFEPSDESGPVPDEQPAEVPAADSADTRSHCPVEGGDVLRAVIREVLEHDPEYVHCCKKPAARQIVTGSQGGAASENTGHPLADYVLVDGETPPAPDEVFGRLRWGGQAVYAARSADAVAEAAAQFVKRGFTLVRDPTALPRHLFGLRLPSWLPFPGRRVHYFIARKVFLTRPREISDRFTYHLQLVPGRERRPRKPPAPRPSAAAPHMPTADVTVSAEANGGGYVVLKEVPTVERVIARLEARFPDAPPDVIVKRARKFSEKIFPIFLTREAAMLQILEKNLPAYYAQRVPHLIDMEQDDRGYVRKLRMNWLRNSVSTGNKPITQLEFASQSADLLHALHDRAGVIHLDLRLDNMVVTEQGVGFIDFGSAVRVNEDLSTNPLLHTLFEELMRTSEIQRMLEKMTRTGRVTSPILSNGCQKVDKAVDFFYLAVQINTPLHNPDFRGLIQFDPASQDAHVLKRMTDEVLRPKDLANPRYRTARDLFKAIREYAVDRGTAA